MDNEKFKPIRHNHKDFLGRVAKRKGFTEAYNALDAEYRLIDEMLKARVRAGLKQDAVADRMGTQ